MVAQGAREIEMKDAEGRVTVLAVVIAGVIALMVEKGPYTWGSTVFGFTLLMILVAYGVPGDRERAVKANERLPTRRFLLLEKAAFGAAFALCVMNGLGPVLNWLPPVETQLPNNMLLVQDLPFLLAWATFAVLGFLLIPYLQRISVWLSRIVRRT